MYPTINKAKTGERIEKLMKSSGKTPRDIQKYLGLACVQSVYRWLEGINSPSIDNFYALSQLFQIPIDEMIVGNRERYICDMQYISVQKAVMRKRIQLYCSYLARSATIQKSTEDYKVD